MPRTARVRSALARYLLSNPSAALRRRLVILRMNPFPPGSRALHADEAWYKLAERFPGLRGYVYGTNQDALIYTYDTILDVLNVEFAVVDGRVVPD